MDNYIRTAGTLTVLVGLASSSCSSNSAMTPDKSRLNLSQSKEPEGSREPAATEAVAQTPTPSALLSCDLRPERGGNSEEHICVVSSSLGSDPSDLGKAASDCAALGGVVGKSCDPAGVVAGCRGSTSRADASITFTYWYYSGTVEHVKESCANPMQVVFTGAGAVGDPTSSAATSSTLTLL